MSRYRILIADDEPAVRDALADLIGMQPDLEVAGIAADAEEAIELARQQLPDVALLDVRMPGGGGPEAARAIRSCSPHSKVLALSAYGDRDTVLKMIRAGAVGYLLKGAAANEIVDTIARAVRGQGGLSTQVTADVIEELAKRLDREDREAARPRRLAERIRDIIQNSAFRIVFQPIMDLREWCVVGVEALSRFQTEPSRSPYVWFQEADEVGLGPDLELAALEAAVAHADRIPSELFISINLSPRTLTSDQFLQIVSALPAGRFVAEVTEHAEVENYEALREPLAALRANGGRLAVDDAGAGFASLRHILKLSPDIIKLDVDLSRGIHRDRTRRALASALISFGEEIGYAIVAEGIETLEELNALRDLGAFLGQGFYLGSPKPLPLADPPCASPLITGNGSRGARPH